MAYAPSTQDRTAEFIFNGLQGQAAANQRREEFNAVRAQQGLQNLAESMSLLDQTLAKQRSNLGALEALKAAGPNAGITQDELDALAKINHPDKLAGALAMYGGILEQRQREAYLDKQLETGRQLWNHKVANPMPTQQRTPAAAPTYLPAPRIGEGIKFGM